MMTMIMLMMMMIVHDDDDYGNGGDILPVDVVEYFRRLVVDDIVLPDLGTVLESALSTFIISQDW